MSCDHDWLMNWTDEGTYVYWCEKCREINENIPKTELCEKFLILEHKIRGCDNKANKKDLARYRQQQQWIVDRLPPIYSEEELTKLEKLFVGATDSYTVERFGDSSVDFWLVAEPTKIDIDRLKNHPQNNQIYGLEEDISDLTDQIKESGWIKRLTINLDGEVLGGNRRLLVAKDLKASKKPISLLDIEIKRFKTREEELRFLILDNATREKTPMQRLREAKALKVIRELLLKKLKNKGEELTLEEQLFLNRWEQTKQVLQEKKGTTVKSRDILAKQVGLGSGVTLDKAMVVGEVCDFLLFQGRNQEAFALEKEFNEDGVDPAYKSAQEWLKANPIDWIYNGESLGDKLQGSPVKVVYSMQSSHCDQCWIDFGDGHPMEVFKNILILPPPPAPKLIEKEKSLKFKVGDRVADKITKFEGEVSRIEGDKYVIDFDNQSRAVGVLEKSLIAKPKVVDFKLGEFYSDDNSVGLCTFIGGCGDIKILWVGMGNSLAPKDCEESFPRDNLPSLSLYRFDPTKPPTFLNKKLQVGERVALANKVRDPNSLMQVLAVGEYITVEALDGSRIEMSEKNLILLQNRSFAVGDSVTVAEGLRCPFATPSGMGLITALYRVCCDVRFGKQLYRLHYSWLRSCQLQIDYDVPEDSTSRGDDGKSEDSEPQETLGEAILNCTTFEEVSSLLTGCTRKEVENAVKDLWQALKNQQ